ncbi:hypothetical protein DMC30DRAFT_415814 [Rhodotorula diobovata]|uniref:Uncharacterized protein n=1 Tax=Rhodotorula diobovata TaxID=5288 RepID=A0A5C5FZZ1_9BASI|nr:hypothetical protein DMC30DRAFT_415814 [Rhodotorula diobovata]
MVRLSASCALLALSALPLASAGPLGFFQDASNKVVRGGLRNILRLNETQIDRILATEDTPLEPHPFAFDLTDDNYETLLATGTEDNPFAPPLPREDVWVVTVHGPDPVSKMFLAGMDEVATHNSSAAGGSLPAHMHFARLNYARETILPTRWWLWRTPVIVLGTNRMRTLRFVRPGNVRPNVESLSELLSKPDLWKQVEVWEGRLAPGGSFEDRLHRLAKIWAKIHRESSKVPKFALLALSGFIMNFVVSWFHKDDDKKQARFMEQVEKAREDQAAATWAAAKETTTAPAPASAPAASTTPAKKRASKRK